MREAIRVGYGFWSLVVANAAILALLALSFVTPPSRSGRRATRTRPASAALRVRLLADPCLWGWEIADGDGALVYSSWANEWNAYASREEAFRAGEARLAELTRAA